MRLTHLGHACLLVEMADTRILIDPGTFSDDFTTVRDLGAIVITHQHADHLDPNRLPAVVSANPQAIVLSDPQSVPILQAMGVGATGHQSAGTSVGGVSIEPVGERHALIHEEIPVVTNVGVRLSAEGEPTLYHPGDSLDNDPGKIDVLAFPLNAPWQRSREMTAFLRSLAAPRAVPIHDRLLSEAGRGLYLGQAGRLGCADTQIVDLAGRGAQDFTAAN